MIYLLHLGHLLPSTTRKGVGILLLMKRLPLHGGQQKRYGQQERYGQQ